MLLGISFGYKIAIATVGLYLLEGIIGIPVFSNSPERGVGLVYFTGPTMGYLIGFLSACFLASYVNKDDNYMTIFMKLTISVSTIYITRCFMVRNTYRMGQTNFLKLGVMPFLLAEIFKICITYNFNKKII